MSWERGDDPSIVPEVYVQYVFSPRTPSLASTAFARTVCTLDGVVSGLCRPARELAVPTHELDAQPGAHGPLRSHHPLRHPGRAEDQYWRGDSSTSRPEGLDDHPRDEPERPLSVSGAHLAHLAAP